MKEVGISQDAIDDILINNPREILTFDKPGKFDLSKVNPRVLKLKEILKVV